MYELPLGRLDTPLLIGYGIGCLNYEDVAYKDPDYWGVHILD
eukprot:CAMPEP_0116876178 /NCGR_PEP_ID=MMETSP0463-20121206/8186_1 /TAXON_ID=181622 /ORGANISM="Strombidinopsis sp, Strain SopsisLIS2011" /LENGTH=41 /DNA_ID= /DNA_START= /DNA_END= /DNA_ORIENTATION=